jgi:hypothetical protein
MLEFLSEKLSFPQFHIDELVGPGKIIPRLETYKVSLIDSAPVFETNAFLSKSLHGPEQHDADIIYGTMDGSGASKRKEISILKAISEALERWAFYQIVDSSQKKYFGFDLIPTTTGMAAYPSILKYKAKANAYREAIERWTIENWWKGIIPLEILSDNLQKDIASYKLITPFEKVPVVLIKHDFKIKEATFSAYGFSAGRSLNEAYSRALVEASRNYRGLFNTIELNNRIILKRLEEKRLLYFACTEGRDFFEKKVFDSKNIKCLPKKPKLIVDSEIIGPWTKYTTVWRCLFEKNSCDDYISENYFMF